MTNQRRVLPDTLEHQVLAEHLEAGAGVHLLGPGRHLAQAVLHPQAQALDGQRAADTLERRVKIRCKVEEFDESARLLFRTKLETSEGSQLASRVDYPICSVSPNPLGTNSLFALIRWFSD